MMGQLLSAGDSEMNASRPWLFRHADSTLTAFAEDTRCYCRQLPEHCFVCLEDALFPKLIFGSKSITGINDSSAE